MVQRNALQPHEIRIIKVGRKAALELAWEILSEICYVKFRLPHDANDAKQVCIDWRFDAERYEMILLAYNSTYELDKDAAITHINNLSMEATDSLLTNSKGKKYYHSIQDTSFLMQHHNVTDPNSCSNNPGCMWKKLCCNFNSSIRPLRKHEIRVIRLSKQAIQELLWEHFMRIGHEAMGIPENDFSVIFSMHVQGNLEELVLYAINLNEASDSVFEEADAYCDQKICITTDSLCEKPTNEYHYVSRMLTEF